MSFDEAVATLSLRQQEDSVLKRQMITVRDRYNGDFVIPLTGVEGEPEVTPPVPQLLADAIDSTAMRAASTRPQIFVPALNPDSEQSRKRANRRRRAYYAAWHQSKLPLKLRRGIRHLVGYGTNCMGVVPCFERDDAKDYAKIEVRDPLSAYPDEAAPEEVRNPINIGFIYPRSPDWILTVYPEARDYIKAYHSDMWDVFEWIDETNVYIGIMGPRMSWGSNANTPIRGYGSTRGPFKLRQWPNRAGMVPFVTPGRVTLDRVAGAVTKMIPIIDMYGQLMALEAVAAEKAVFADKFIIGRQGEEIVMVSGDEWKDGRAGEVNLLRGVQQVGQLSDAINPSTFQVGDRLERAVRMSSGQPGVFGGELTGAIRSGQTVSQVGAYAIDPRVQEVQEIIEYELAVLNESVHEVTKGYWPRRKYTAFSGWPSDRGYVEYIPERDFEDPSNVVSYGFTGADVSQVSVALGQAMQMKILGRKTAMRKHPLVDNPDEGEREIIEEALQDAALAAFLAQAQQGSLPMIDLANVYNEYAKDGDFIKAVIAAQAIAQKRQAQQAPPPEPGQATAPEQQPGLSPPGQGVEMQPPGGQPNQAGVAQLLQALTSQSGAGAPVPAGTV